MQWPLADLEIPKARVDNPPDVASDFDIFVRLVPRPLTTQGPQISREKPDHFTANTKAETHRDAEQQTISCVPAIGWVSCSLAPSIGSTRHNLGVNRNKNHTHHPRVAITPIVQNGKAAPPRHASKLLTIETWFFRSERWRNGAYIAVESQSPVHFELMFDFLGRLFSMWRRWDMAQELEALMRRHWRHCEF